MAAVSLLMGLCFSLATHRVADLDGMLRVAIGAVSVAFGVWIVVDIGVVQGLFRG
jgi:hypothetical protein